MTQTGTFDDILRELVEKSREANPPAPDDYVNEKGLLVCGKCGNGKEAFVPFPGGKLKKVPVACRCKQEAYEKEQEELRRLDVQRRIRAYLQSQYPDWEESKLLYKKGDSDG